MSHYAYSCPCCGDEVDEGSLMEGVSCGGCGFQYRLVYIEDDEDTPCDDSWRCALKNKGFARPVEEGEEAEASEAG